MDNRSGERNATLRRPLTLEQAMEEASRCLLCEDPPCSRGCPAGTEPARFVRQIRFENFKGAARTIRSRNLFGYACAFTCPVERLCEHDCTRAKLDRPIDICGLQAFACEYGRRHGLEPLEPLKVRRGEVAVIGAGPAGMTCSAELAKLGYKVAIFEREDRPGGAAMWGIPSYRLPEEALEDARRGLEELGVKIAFKAEVCGREALNDLLRSGYEALFISTGLSSSVGLDILRGYFNSVFATDFLRAAKEGREPAEIRGGHVAVIGGGSVAIDAAVAARRLGAKNVTVIVRRNLGALRASDEEIALAHKERIIFRPGSQITATEDDGEGRIVRLLGIGVDWISIDGSPASNATPVAGTGFGLKVDYVIQAIGSTAGDELGEETFSVDESGFTGKPGIFAGGDFVRGGGTIAEAVGDGRRAAESIHRYISGRRI